MNSSEALYAAIQARIAVAAQANGPDHKVALIAVSKTQPAERVRPMAGWGQRAFGENHMQEALGKMRELADLDLQWHFIGALQSNKCREVAMHFDWLQSLDREKLIEPLNRYRSAERAPLNVLIEVRIDDEPNKSGVPAAQVAQLARKIAAYPRLKLRGLMAIPAPLPDLEQRRSGFARLCALYRTLREEFAGLDTLSMGMSEDFELAIAEGATMVRVGSALFGPRVSRMDAAG